MAKVFLSEFIADDMAKGPPCPVNIELGPETLREWLIYAAKLGWKVHFEGFSFGLGVTIATGKKNDYLTHSRVVSWDDIAFCKREAIGFSIGLQIRALENQTAGLVQGEGI